MSTSPRPPSQPAAALLLRGATLADGHHVDVRCAGGAIVAVGPAGTVVGAPGDEVHDLTGWLLLPAPAEPHAHLDKALTADRVPNPAGDLVGAITAWHAQWPTLTVEEIAGRARTAALRGLTNGTTAVRTHVDVSSALRLRSVEALLRVRDELADLVDIQVVALVSLPTAGVAGAEHRALLREALAMGVDLGGGCPHLDDDPFGCLEACLDAAADFERPIDLHVDETLDPAVLGLRDFVELVTKTEFPYGAAASHCVSLGMQPDVVQAEVSELVAAAGIAVVTLPQTNLFLQGRGRRTGQPRGLTAIGALRHAGATVAAGADNLQDPFNTMGRADALETAALLVMAAHLSPEDAYGAVCTSARAAMGLPPVEVAVGFPAELLAVPAVSVRDAVASAPAERLVVRRGRVVVRSRLDVQTAW